MIPWSTGRTPKGAMLAIRLNGANRLVENCFDMFIGINPTGREAV